MADAGTPAGDFLDFRKIRRLAELMNEQDLSEIDIQSGDTRLRLRRKLEADAPAVEYRPMPASGSSSDKGAGAPDIAPADTSQVIKSPMVGSFYASSKPDAAAFVKVGDHVGPETTVCIIEAMKVFNEIPAEMSGKIVAVLVENGEPVEFGQPLCRVDPNQ
jgi:acetyl-CoA carboxylase biotin carboxyl carrier protein